MNARWSRRAALAAFLVLLVCGCGTPPSQQYEQHVYVLAVPTMGEDGVSMATRVTDFESFLARKAGGFSLLGRDIGGWLEAGAVQREENYYYLVYADKDIGGMLAAEIKKRFDQKKPFVVAMPARWEQPSE